MKNLFDSSTVEETRRRIAALTPESPRQWGKMTPAQAVAHCSIAVEWAVGDTIPPRRIVLGILGRIIKPKVFGDDQPIRRNSPTDKTLVVTGDQDLEEQRQRLIALIDRFSAGGPKGCTTNPHCFFGPLTPEEWAILMYKHVDHHLRQFGA
jgi:hypothetical protein